MAEFSDILGVVDRAHLPKPGTQDVARFKEWYHFNVLDPAHGVDLIANVSLNGNVVQAGGGMAEVILLCHDHDKGWSGGIDSYDGAAITLARHEIGVSVADAGTVHYADGAYGIDLHMRDGSVEFIASLAPRTEPMLVWSDTTLGSGRLNWLIVPHLAATGLLRMDGKSVDLCEVCAYHDHNWGYWKWGEDFAWEWGFSADMATRSGDGRIIVVFDRTSDRARETNLEHTLAIWRDDTLVKVFTRQMLRARRSGRFAGDVSRIPGSARLVAQGRVLTVPAEISVSARNEEDWLDVVYRVDAALQVCVPSELGFGHVELNETLGILDVRGVIGGDEVEFSARASFEFLA